MLKTYWETPARDAILLCMTLRQILLKRWQNARVSEQSCNQSVRDQLTWFGFSLKTNNRQSAGPERPHAVAGHELGRAKALMGAPKEPKLNKTDSQSGGQRARMPLLSVSSVAPKRSWARRPTMLPRAGASAASITALGSAASCSGGMSPATSRSCTRRATARRSSALTPLLMADIFSKVHEELLHGRLKT